MQLWALARRSAQSARAAAAEEGGGHRRVLCGCRRQVAQGRPPGVPGGALGPQETLARALALASSASNETAGQGCRIHRGARGKRGERCGARLARLGERASARARVHRRRGLVAPRLSTEPPRAAPCIPARASRRPRRRRGGRGHAGAGVLRGAPRLGCQGARAKGGGCARMGIGLGRGAARAPPAVVSK
ncbi:MAG: hypothetical protein J3K34DRAFT_406077 [Monoraphidium minutum]|nr:MAG: hypothetical protein J3K34DRAFT_406077 [Monoraphidium minutum]